MSTAKDDSFSFYFPILLHFVYFSCQERIGESRDSGHLAVCPQVWPTEVCSHVGSRNSKVLMDREAGEKDSEGVYKDLILLSNFP